MPVEVKLPPIFDLLRERARKMMAEHYLAEISYPCRVRCLDGDWEHSLHAASLLRTLEVRGVARLPVGTILHGYRGALSHGRVAIARKDWSIRAQDTEGRRFESVAVENIAHALELVSQ